MFKKMASSIQFKIAFPYVLLIMVIALIAGPVSNLWVTDQIEKSNDLYLQEESRRFKGIIENNANNLQLYSKIISEDEEVSKLYLKEDKKALSKLIIPLMTKMKLDFVEIIDSDGLVLLNLNGPYDERNNISYLNLIRLSQLEMNSVELMTYTKPVSMAAVNPIRSPSGVVGHIIVGQQVNDNYLSQIPVERTANISIIVDGKPIASAMSSSLKKKGLLDIPKNINGEEYFQQLEVDQTKYKVLYTSLIIGGNNFGYIATIMSQEDVAKAKSTITSNVIMLNSLIIIMMIGIAFILTKVITKPLTQLTGAARNFIKNGDSISTIPSKGSDEVAELTETFNKMTKNIVLNTKELRARVSEFTALYEMTKNLGATLDMKEVMDNVINTVLATLNADTSSIMLLDEEKETLFIAHSIGLEDPKLKKVRINVGERIAGWVAEKGKPMLISDVVGDRYLFNGKKNIHQISAICVPLIAHQEILGVLNVSKETEEKIFTQDDLQLLTTIGGQAAIALKNAILFKEIENLYLRTVKALAKAIEAKDPYTRGHSERVAELAVWIAREIGLNEEEVRGIETAAYLHDIGKIGIEDKVLLKPSALDKNERELIEKHPDISYSILKPINFPWDIATIVRHHHEFYNGQGYVTGKKGDEIPVGSRILTVADAFEAMTSERPYRKAKNSHDAIEELERCAGSQFDPNIVRIFKKIWLRQCGVKNIDELDKIRKIKNHNRSVK